MPPEEAGAAEPERAQPNRENQPDNNGESAEAARLLATAQAHYKAKKHAEAARLCEELLETAPDRTDALLLLGASCYQRGDHAACIQHNKRAIAINPSLAEAHGNMAHAMQDTGELDAAIESYVRSPRPPSAPRRPDAPPRETSHRRARGEVCPPARRALREAPPRATPPRSARSG